MENYSNTMPVDKEIAIGSSSSFSCKISPDGFIEYANHHFCQISGYEEHELIGESMEKLRHPGMPMIFFDVLLDRLQSKEPMRIIAKFLARDGRYFWLMVDFETKVDEDGTIIAHYTNSKAAPQYAVHKVSALHNILSKIEEKTGGTETSKRYLVGFLEERNVDYDQYVHELTSGHPEYEKPFQQQDLTHLSDVRDNDFSQTEVLDFDRPNQGPSGLDKNRNIIKTPSNQRPKTKKRSLLKKVFGK